MRNAMHTGITRTKNHNPLLYSNNHAPKPCNPGSAARSNVLWDQVGIGAVAGCGVIVVANLGKELRHATVPVADQPSSIAVLRRVGGTAGDLQSGAVEKPDGALGDVAGVDANREPSSVEVNVFDLRSPGERVAKVKDEVVVRFAIGLEDNRIGDIKGGIAAIGSCEEDAIAES